MRTPEELKRIAGDMKLGLIFHDNMIAARHVQRCMPLVFLPMFFLSRDKRKLAEFRAQKPRLVFEYYDKASPLKVNGRYPSFQTMQFLTTDEWPLFLKIQEGMLFKNN